MSTKPNSSCSISYKASCPICSNSFYKTRPDRVFCSNRCKCKSHRICNSYAKEKLKSNQVYLNRNFIIFNGLISKYCNSIRVHKDLLFNLKVNLEKFEETVKVKGFVYCKIGDLCFRVLKNGLVHILRLGEKMIVEDSKLYDRWLISFPLKISSITFNISHFERIFVREYERF